MTGLWTMCVAIGLFLHIFVMAMETGATQAKMEKKKILAIAFVFMSVQVLLQGLGVVLVWLFERIWKIHLLSRGCLFMTFALLLGIGTVDIREALKKEEFQEHKEENLSLKACIWISVRAGLTAFVLGMCLYYLNTYSWRSAVVTIAGAFLGAVGGFTFGHLNGVAGRKGICISDAVLAVLLAFRVIFYR